MKNLPISQAFIYLFGCQSLVGKDGRRKVEPEVYEELEKNQAFVIFRKLAAVRHECMYHVNPFWYGGDRAPEGSVARRLEELESYGFTFPCPCDKRNTNLQQLLTEVNNIMAEMVPTTEELFGEYYEQVKSLLVAPAGLDWVAEKEKYQANRSAYPYMYYLYRENPREQGNYVFGDTVFKEFLREEFDIPVAPAQERVADAKRAIRGFIEGRKTEIFIDSENADPTKVGGALEDVDLSNSVIHLFLDDNTVELWSGFTSETVGAKVVRHKFNRCLENKSIVDQTLCIWFTMAFKDGVRNMVLCSSDSDYSILSEVFGTECDLLILGERRKISDRWLDHSGVKHVLIDDFCHERIVRAAVRKSGIELVRSLLEESDRKLYGEVRKMLYQDQYDLDASLMNLTVKVQFEGGRLVGVTSED